MIKEKNASKETGCFHARWSSPPHMHFLAFPEGFLMVKALSYLNTQGNLKCIVKDVGASEKPKI